MISFSDVGFKLLEFGPSWCPGWHFHCHNQCELVPQFSTFQILREPQFQGTLLLPGLYLPFLLAFRPAVKSARKKQTVKKQKTSKILVRNIPFQATVREIRELFR